MFHLIHQLIMMENNIPETISLPLLLLYALDINNGFPRYAYKEKKIYVLIEGQKFPIIGKSSMNMVVVDITDEEP